MIDVDQILRDHADTAAAAGDPSPDGWDRLVARLEDDPPIVVAIDDLPRSGRGARRLLLASAAAIVVGIVVAAIALVDRDGSEPTGPATTTELPVTTAAPTTAPGTTVAPTSEPVAPSTTSTPAPPSARPDEVAAILDEDGDGLGAIVLLGAPVDGPFGPDGPGGQGEVRAVLVDAPEPPAEVPGSASAPVSVDRLPDGSVVYGTCCEPAIGSVWIVGPDGGEPRFLGYGERPAASPDGTKVAVFRSLTGVGLIDVATGDYEDVLVAGEPLALEPDDWATGLAWSPDGTRLLVDWLVHDEKMDDTYRVIELADLVADERRSVFQEGDTGGAAHGTFLADGRIAFVTGVPHAYDQPVTGTGISVFDPATGEAEPRFGALRITGLDTTADGHWVLATSEDGAVRAFTGAELVDEGTLTQHEGLQAAAW